MIVFPPIRERRETSVRFEIPSIKEKMIKGIAISFNKLIIINLHFNRNNNTKNLI